MITFIITALSLALMAAVGAIIYAIFVFLKLKKTLESIDFKTATVSLDSFHDLTIEVSKPLSEDNILKLVEELDKKPGFIVKFFFGDGSQLHLTKQLNAYGQRDPFCD